MRNISRKLLFVKKLFLFNNEQAPALFIPNGYSESNIYFRVVQSCVLNRRAMSDRKCWNNIIDPSEFYDFWQRRPFSKDDDKYEKLGNVTPVISVTGELRPRILWHEIVLPVCQSIGFFFLQKR